MPIDRQFRAPRTDHPKSRYREQSGQSGQSWIRTNEGVSQRIYSPPRLATSVSARGGGEAYTCPVRLPQAVVRSLLKYPSALRMGISNRLLAEHLPPTARRFAI